MYSIEFTKAYNTHCFLDICSSKKFQRIRLECNYPGQNICEDEICSRRSKVQLSQISHTRTENISTLTPVWLHRELNAIDN